MELPNAGQPANAQVQTATPTSDISNPPVAAPDSPTALPENNAPNVQTAQAQPAQPEQPTQAQAPQLSEEATNYLRSQNINLSDLGIDASNQAVVDAYIAGHKSMRNANNRSVQSAQASKATAEDVLGTALATPANTQAQGQQVQVQSLNQTQQVQPETQTQPTTASPISRTISEIDIVNMKNYLESQHKDVDASKLGTKEFYAEMREFGLSPVTATGDWNLQAINRYAGVVAQREKIAQLENDIKNRPTTTIPTATDTIERIDETAQRVDNMTEQAAQNIIIASNRARKTGGAIHPQYQQAVDFMSNYFIK